MLINTNQILTMTEANQNFSRAARLAETNGSAVIFKNNRPKYILVDVAQNPVFELTENEKIDIVAKRVLEKYRSAFEELAK
ncbi:MAG: type II toxin-antitoxin system Phd/YefM family antitoxin [Clostridiales bacterium]|jgi:antitoxin Phd|nr:type II toxin-antitoxin system Phd/YefM family antitoxin [Clostridiales bacterium]